MTINAETAILILKTVAWCNHDWHDALGWEISPDLEADLNSKDFLRLCKDLGIEEVTLYEDR